MIAKSSNMEYPWLSWIPIGNWYIMIKLNGKEDSYFFISILLMIIPIVNIVVVIKILHGISERVGY